MNRRIFWALGLAGTFALFYDWLPNSIYNTAPFIISLLGAILFFFFLVQLIGDFNSFQEFNKPAPGTEKTAHKVAPFMVLPGLVMLFVFIMHFHAQEKRELKEFGQEAVAVVIDGKSLKSRRGATYTLKLRYKTREGAEITVSESVGESEFKRVGLGQEIPIIYSSQNPQMIELVLSDDAVRDYLNIEQRSLSLTDLLIIDTLAREEINQYLNTISYKWIESEDEDGIYWENNSMSEAIIKRPDNVLSFFTTNNSSERQFQEDLLSYSFEETTQADSASRAEIYDNGTHRLSHQQEIDLESGGSQLHIYYITHLYRYN